MPTSTGISFTLSDALKEAEKMDNHFDSWVRRSIEIQENMRKAFDAKSGGDMRDFNSSLRTLQSLIKEVGGSKLSVNVDSTKVEQMASALDAIVRYVGLLDGSSSEIFDTQGLYAANKSLVEAEDNLENIREEIDAIKEKWRSKTDAALEGEFEPPVNSRTGKAFGKDTKAYKHALEQEIERTREQRKEEQAILEFQLRAAIEREAIAKRELNYAKMTQDEKAQYIKKRLDEILKAEEQQANKIRAEYKKLWSDLNTYSRSRSTIDKASEGKTMTDEQKAEYDSLVSLEEQTEARIQQMYSEHQETLSDITMREMAKRSKRIAEELKNQTYDAKTALDLASKARTGTKMEEAKEAVKSALMTVDKDDLDTIDELNKAYLNLRASIEKLTKAQKNEQTLQPSIRNEYRRILKELDDLHAAQERLRNTDAYKGLLSTKDAQDAADAMTAFDAREKDLLDKKVKYEQEAGNLLDEVVRENAKRQADIRLQEFEKAQKELEAREKKYGSIDSFEADQVIWDNSHADNVRKSQKAIEELTEARDKLNKYDSDYEHTLDSLNKEIKKHEEFIESVTKAEEYREKQQKKQRETYKGAMDYSKQAKSINDLKEAIRVLDVARQKEDLNTRQGKKNYRELTRELEAQQNRYDELTQKVKSSNKGMIDTAGQLKRAFGLLFSVSQIRGYIHQIVEVRGEFEMQHRSMQVLIGDIDKANELWDKTISLATKSPFRVKELVTYTKQLAAYRVEADKLYETNKMLADISSGLGVDMNRLILAFGQVKAANYLRGTELRQFSEAGINILELLAKRFEEIQGRAISTGEVFEMVSKRLVSFEDVNAVLQQVTSEGGMFYQMQEKQSETLQGMVRNLRDSIDLMMNDMGVSMNDELKDAVTLVKTLVDEWRKLVPIVAAIGTAMLFSAARKGVLALVGGIDKMIKGFNRLRAASSAASAVNPWLLLATVIASVTAAIIAARKEVNRLVAAMGQVESNNKKQLTESISLYRKLAESANDATKTELERDKAMKNLEERFKSILPDSLLEADYVKQLGDNYEEANRAMMAYYDAKTREQKKEKIDAMFDSDIYEKKFPKLISGIKHITETTSVLSEEQKILVESYAGNIFGEIIDSAKRGEIEVGNLFETFKARLAEYTEISSLEIDEMFRRGGTAWVEDRLESLGELLVEYQNTLSGITGLSYTTRSEEVAMEWKNAEKENLEAIMAEYKKFATYYHQFATANQKDRKKISDSVTLSLSQVPESLALYKPHLEEAVQALKDAAEGGAWEFAKSMQTIEQDFVIGLSGIVARSVNVQEYDAHSFAGEFLANFATNMREGILEAGENLDLSAFQEGIIDGVEKIAEKTKVSVDEFAKYLPKMGESLSDVKNRVSGDIETLQNRVEDYTTSISSGLYETSIVSDKILNESPKQIEYFEKELIPALQLFLQLLGDVEKSKGKGGGESLMDERIKVVDDMNRAYTELNKTLSKNEALEGAFAKYKDAFQKAYAGTTLLPKNFGTMTAEQFLEEFNFTTEEGMVGFFDKLIAYAKKTGEQVDVELAKGEYIMEARVELKKDEDKKLLDSIQELFDQYDLSLELKELGIPPDLAKSLFGIESITLADIRKKVQGELDSAKAAGGQEDRIAQLEKDLEKINDMEDKASIERMKTYSKYLLEGMNERVRLKMEELKKLKEIEEVAQYSPAQKARIKAQVSKEAKAEQQKLEWQDFQGTEMYTMMFDDIEFMGTKALEVLKGKLEELKGSLKDLPASDVKEIINQISKIEDITIERNPFTSLRDAMKEVKELQAKGRTEESLQKTFADAEIKRKSYQDELDAINLVLNAKDKEGLLNEVSEEWMEKYGFYIKMQTNDLEKQAIAYDALTTGQEMVSTNAKNDLDTYADARKSLEAVAKQWETFKQLADSAWGSAKQIMESLGVESDSLAMTIGDTAMSMVDLVSQAIMFDVQLKALTMQAKALGIQMNAALGPIGWVVLALQAVATLLTAIFSAKDKALEKQVEENLDKVERLQEAYDKIEESIDNAWDTASIQAYNQELKATTQSMIDAQRAAIAAQSKRKGANKEGSDAYNELQDMKAELDELETQLDESLANSFSKVTDGILDSVHDAAREFTDAWWDAFIETGDGLKGLEENFNEMFLNLAKNQAAMQITGAFADRWKKDLEEYINEDDTELTKDEARKWAQKVRDTFPELSDALEGYLGAFKDMATEAEGVGLSALQKGIQGVTEETAQVIEALLNSMRFYVADSNTELKNQTRYLSDIYSLLSDAMSNSTRAFSTKLV